MKKLVRAI